MRHHLTPALAWTLSLALWSAAWVLLPGFRPYASLVLLLHIPVLVWGVASIRSQFFGPVLVRAAAGSRTAALTFDDGPDPELTPAVLDMLDEFGTKATFFVIAKKAAVHPDILRHMVASGHAVECHDLYHSPWSNFRRDRRMYRDITEANKIIGEITGHPPAWYRPPSGLMNPHVLPVLTRLGMRCAGWSCRAVDFGNRSIRAVQRIPDLAGPGEIILLHDTAPDPARRELFLASLRSLLERIRAMGLECVTIDRIGKG